MLQEVEEIKHKVVSKIKQDAANKESSVIYDVYDGRVQLITMCKHHRCRWILLLIYKKKVMSASETFRISS